MKRVLIVDDEVDLCLLIKNYLSRKNYEVYTAHTLSDGFRKLETIVPDVLLLDNNLPDGMGWKEAENIHRRFPNLVITLLSAYQTPKDFNKDDIPVNVLEKPVSLTDIEQYL
ncbi:MAG: response regulator [Chitinophagaceae bacterium]|nr:response regulator [Chitinophagaceae bacterium]